MPVLTLEADRRTGKTRTLARWISDHALAGRPVDVFSYSRVGCEIIFKFVNEMCGEHLRRSVTSPHYNIDLDTGATIRFFSNVPVAKAGVPVAKHVAIDESEYVKQLGEIKRHYEIDTTFFVVKANPRPRYYTGTVHFTVDPNFMETFVAEVKKIANHNLATVAFDIQELEDDEDA